MAARVREALERLAPPPVVAVLALAFVIEGAKRW